MPLIHRAFFPLLVCITLFTLGAVAMPISYAQAQRTQSHTSSPPAMLSDPFGSALLTLLDDAQDIASERVWQEIPRLIARQWGSFTQYQSPLSTMGMISRAAETVLKIRLTAGSGGGAEEA